MDTAIAAAIQEASELLGAGKKVAAHAILVSVVKQNPDVAQAWYLLGLTLTDLAKKLYCFRQVLRIDPAHQAAQNQFARLTDFQLISPDVGAFTVEPFSITVPAFVAAPKPVPTLLDKLWLRKNRPMLLIGVALAMVGLIAASGALALYVSNGMKLSQQVDTLFRQRKCIEVVQYASFGESFPRFVFSSFFGVYHQVEECQAKLALEQVLKEQDWPAAYGIIQNYLVIYPSGAFAAEMIEQAGKVLFSWSKSLMLQNDYKAATEKLEILQRGFFSSSAAPDALKTMFDDYLLWGKYLYDQKDYQNAERVLKIVGWHEKASPEQIKQADQGLVAVYLQWGKAQIENGEYDEAIYHFGNAKNLDDSVDYDRLKNQVPLVQADALAKATDFDGALAIVKTTLEKPLSEGSRADAVAEQAKILNAYAHSLSRQGRAQMTVAAANMCKRQPATTEPIFGKDTDTVRFAIVAPLNLQLPNQWTARTPAELHYIACVDQTQSRIEGCLSKEGNAVRRYRSDWEIRLYDVLTGELYQATDIFGSRPVGCEKAEFGDLYGDPPTIQQVVDWLVTLNIFR